MDKKKIILTGGGTAGHITPNIALLPFLTGYEVHYVGQPDSMEQELIGAESGVIFHALPCVKLSRSNMLKNLAVPFKLCRAKALANQIIKEVNPAVIFSKGGYVALPVMLAAKNIPLILHESDYSMGLANKLAVKKCRYACCSFSHLAKSLNNGVATGAPLRQSLYSGSKLKAEAECNLRGRKNLLIFGGSLGAKAVNEVVFNSLDALTKRFDVVHITGKNNTRDIKHERYFTLPFTKNIADYFAWADLVVTRGGANALFELAALSKPSLVIPLPKGASRGDQLDNAEYFERLGCFHVLNQENLTDSTLIAALEKLDAESFRLKVNMSKCGGFDGTSTIAELIKECAENK